MESVKATEQNTSDFTSYIATLDHITLPLETNALNPQLPEISKNFDKKNFEIVFSILAAQRHAKVIGIFTRLWKRDGKPAYLIHIPRVWALLEAALENPVLSDLKGWFDKYLPTTMRSLPEMTQ